MGLVVGTGANAALVGLTAPYEVAKLVVEGAEASLAGGTVQGEFEGQVEEGDDSHCAVSASHVDFAADSYGEASVWLLDATQPVPPGHMISMCVLMKQKGRTLRVC